jgi:hypothetical protein
LARTVPMLKVSETEEWILSSVLFIE